MSVQSRAQATTPAGHCPDCGAPDRFCVCVLRARMEGAKRREREAAKQMGEYRALWNAAASCLHYNRDRLRKPRGKDEARMLAHVEHYREFGAFWSGNTDGWLPDVPGDTTAQPSPNAPLEFDLGGSA